MKKSIYTKQQATLLEMLIEARAAIGLTQGELALHLGLTQSEVSKFERGERGLDVLQLRAWVGAVGLPFVEFISELDARLGPREGPVRIRRRVRKSA
jgi:transcriptional regulator with XRE-family HTH domain